MIDSHLFLYSDVEQEAADVLVRDLHYLDVEKREARDDTPIILHLHTMGGNPYTAFAVANFIDTLQTPVETVIEGCCVSAGVVIALAGSVRYIMPDAFVMIHELYAEMSGDFSLLQDEMQARGMLMGRIANYYVTHTKCPRDRIDSMLSRNTWMEATSAIHFGFVHAIYKAKT